MGHQLLVRHSTTDASASGRNLGQRSDPPLTSEGERLAERLGLHVRQELAELPISQLRLVTSPARRCRQTLAAVATAIGHKDEPEVDERLLEIDYGAWEGLTADECWARDPDLRAAWERDPFATRTPDGESGADVAARAFPVFEAIEEWLSADRSRVAVIVAHNHVNRLHLTALLRWPMASYRKRVSQDPACYSIIGFGGAAGPIVRRLNVRPR
jgi:broad specificity phosphatase PhoE